MSAIQYEENYILGRGGLGPAWQGSFLGSKVVVKKVRIERSQYLQQEEQSLLDLHHPHVIALLHVENDDYFKYYALELCQASLEDYVNRSYDGPMPSEAETLYQMANGLEYIHSCNLVHANLKPSNVLISFNPSLRIKLSEFGLNKHFDDSHGTLFVLRGVKGTLNWLAPEFLRIVIRRRGRSPVYGSVQVDTFAMGCLFFNFLTRGAHPFGSETFVTANILKGNAANLTLLMNQDHFAFFLIERMIESNPTRRMNIARVVDHLSSLVEKEPFITLDGYQNLTTDA